MSSGSSIASWRHFNQPLKYRGLTSLQLAFGLLLPLILTSVNILIAVIIFVVEIFVWRWYAGLQKNGDPDPFLTKRIRESSPDLIQDHGDFYYELLNPEEDK